MALVRREFEATSREFTVDTEHLSLLCICGHHVNGSYLAILNLGISAELSPYGDIGYNTARIAEAINSIGGSILLPQSSTGIEELSKEIATAIDPYIKQTEEELEKARKNIMGREVTS